MGYTHYYRNKPAFTDAQWEQLKIEARQLFKTCGVPLANGLGKRGTKPHINDNYISFNGVEDNAYETAYLSKDAVEFEFCKTNRKPYDKVVVEFYKLIRKFAPQTTLYSDGGDGVFGGSKIIVNGKYTFLTGDFSVNVGDTVELPSKIKPGTTWKGIVTTLGSNYCGDIKTILGVTPLKVPTKPIVVKPTPVAKRVCRDWFLVCFCLS